MKKKVEVQAIPEGARDRKARAYVQLKREIMTLARTPGSDLDEVRLSEEFGLSRPPLREVLRQLAGEGYVEIKDNRSARVSEMSHKTLRDFFLAAPMIYSAVGRLAAQNATETQIQALREAQAVFRKALASGDVAERSYANARFHAIVGEMADNTFLLPSLHRLLIDHTRIGMTFCRPRDRRMSDRLEKASAQHEAMIEAIESGDEEKVARLTIEHWNLSRRNIEMFVTPREMDLPLGTLSSGDRP